MKIRVLRLASSSHRAFSQLGLERAEALVIGDRLRHVIAPIAGHPAAEPQVEVFDPAGEVDRVVPAELQELAAIDRQHRPGRGGQVALVDDTSRSPGTRHIPWTRPNRVRTRVLIPS